jgi:hypothetical protein
MYARASHYLWTVGLVATAAATGIAQAGEIYKSVDANGNTVYSDHADPSKPQTTVVLLEDPHHPPREMHVCGTKNCFTLLFDNGSYRRADGTDDTWTVETFTAQSVVLRRHGTTTAGTDVTYSGDVVNDRLVNVTMNGNPADGVEASWGAALNTLPGSNAERDANNLAVLNAPSSGGVSAAAAPPPLPAEEQPEVTDPGYLWTPGYWYWRDQGYFWVPGAWVRPPQTGFLWTPGFWALAGTVFVFHPGHWGPTVGFYGGINYGHGYFGAGYTGGRWVGGSFAYNSSVNRLGAAIQYTYSEPPPHPASRSLVSYNAGSRGVLTNSTATRHQHPVIVAANASNDSPTVAPNVAAPRKANPRTSIKATAPKK